MALPGAPTLSEDLRTRLATELAGRGPEYEPRTRNLRADGSPLYTNRLLLESSPYLQQHAHNPVNWRPWGDEAFAAAERLGRPVLVSIGYSTCHWCHVMEEESFDDPNTARFLNQHFVTIKVDRETRPDVDAIYMSAIQALGQRGGWPLNVWLTPDRKPFYAGTYFPPQPGPGRPDFMSVLHSIQKQYSDNPEEILRFSADLTERIRADLEGTATDVSRIPGADVMRLAADRYARVADPTWGGVGQQTKFPSRLPIRFLLRYQRRTGDSRALDMATLALDKMAAGGIYDHVGGGFHRYSTEVRWLVPHFEKMLYDNAQLSLAYLEAFQVTGRPEYERIVRETLDYVIREMTSPEGGFYSASDADSIGPSGETEEGYFYTWTPAELDAVLGQELAQTFGAYYGVTEAGNFEGRNILHHWRELARVAKDLGASPDSVRSQLVDARAKLYAARSKRPAPLRDDKILVGWNGLMISSFARAGFVLGEASYTRHAVRAAELILDHGLQENRLRRVLRGTRARGPAFLEDYSFAIAAFLDLYEAAPDPRWIRAAERLQSTLDEHYHDDIGGGYFRSANDHESLIAREKPSRDGALPAGNGVAALNLLRLSEYTQNIAYIESASLLFSAYYDALTQRPTSIAEMLLAVDYQTETTKEIVIVAPSSGADPSAMLAPLRNHYLPSRIVSIVRQGADLEAHAGVVPLVRDKKAQGGAVTAYVCENRVCDAPTTDPAVFAGQISKTARLEFE